MCLKLIYDLQSFIFSPFGEPFQNCSEIRSGKTESENCGDSCTIKHSNFLQSLIYKVTYQLCPEKVSKGAKIRNRYNQ